MKYLRNFTSFRGQEKTNEELLPVLGKIFGSLKNLWNKVIQGLKSLGEDPSIDDIDNYLENKIFNPKDPNYIFKTVIDEFNKKVEVNDEECLSLVTKILDPVEGSLGQNGLKPLYDNLKKVYKENLAPMEIVKYIIETARNNVIKQYKYAGGVDVKIGGKLPKTLVVQDKNHLPLFKAELAKGKDGKTKKKLALNWVQTKLTKSIIENIRKIEADEVEKYLKSKNIEIPEGGGEDYKEGDKVLYKKDDWEKNKADDIWKKLSDDEKKKPEEGKLKELIDNGSIGIKVVKKIEDDVVRFTDVDWVKDKKEILGKIEGGGGEEGQSILLKWKKAEIEVKRIKTADEGGTGIYNFKVVKSTSQKLKVSEKDEVLATIDGMAKKGQSVRLKPIYRNGKEDPMREYQTGNLEKITVDGKEVNEYEMSKKTGGAQDEKKLKDNMGELQKKGKVKAVVDYTEFLKKGDKSKEEQINKIISGK